MQEANLYLQEVNSEFRGKKVKNLQELNLKFSGNIFINLQYVILKFRGKKLQICKI